MRIGGLQKLTVIDYPGKVACVIFTQGCNFRCRYCHNPELVVAQKFCPFIPEDQIIEFLELRRKYLQGVVVSGGEPTVQGDLAAFLTRIKQRGYLIKLDTNGSRPDVMRQLITSRLIDFIAMDVKSPLEKYEEIIDTVIDVNLIRESIDLIVRSGIEHQFRTTVVKQFCSSNDLCAIRQLFPRTSEYYLQNGRMDEKILDKSLLSQQQYTPVEFVELKQSMVNDTR